MGMDIRYKSSNQKMEIKPTVVFLNIRGKAKKGGQEVTINKLIEGLNKAYSITYIGHKKDINYENVIYPFTPLLKLLPIKRGFGKLLRISLFRYMFLRKVKLNCDIIVMNGKSDYTFLLRNKNYIKYKSVLIIKHGRFQSPYPDIIIKNKNYRIVVLNSNEEKKLESIYGAEKIKLIRTGAESSDYNINRDVRRKFGIPDRSYVILSIGRLEEDQKRFSDGIYAIKLATETNKDLVYVIIGDGIDKPKYEKLIKKLNLQNNVKLLGRVSEDDKKGFLNESSILLITSAWETLGLTMVEAFRSHLPVLTTKTDGSLDAVKDVYNGFFTTGNPEDIANKILNIRNLPKEKLKEIAENAYRTANLYSYNKMISLYKSIIEELTDSKDKITKV